MSARTFRRLRPAALVAATVATAFALGACSGGSTDAASSPAGGAASDGAFPVTIESALGEAVIEEKPERVVTWGWSTQDAVLALGVVPVAMPAYKYGGNADGVLPWVAEKLDEMGAETPTLLSGGDTSEVPFEEVVAAKPDVILAPYSGMTQEEFDKLSKIAPVVAFPDEPWSLSWQDQLEIVGEALGLSEEAAALEEETTAGIAAQSDAYPVIKDKSFFYAAANTADQLNVYRAGDPRVQVVEDLGMTLAPSVAELDADPSAGTFWYPLSYENVSKIETDVLIMYFATQADVDTFVADQVIAAMPAIAEGRFAPIVGESFVMASSAPTVLSIPWMLDQYVPQLATAAEKVS
jgi:iron complex transport system substrate-binding protein